jgi:hypothetical protein
MSGRAALTYLIRLSFVLSLKKINRGRFGQYLPALAGLAASMRSQACPTAVPLKAILSKVREMSLMLDALVGT